MMIVKQNYSFLTKITKIVVTNVRVNSSKISRIPEEQRVQPVS